MADSPTTRSKSYYEKQGYKVAIVEKWNPHVGIRQDMFGLFDLIAVGFGDTIGVQTTSYSNMAKRVTKITEADITPILRKCGWKLVVHGWKKDIKTKKWVVREVDCS